MTDDSYHNIMPIYIGIGIGISIGKIFSSVLGIESIGKKWYRSTFTNNDLESFTVYFAVLFPEVSVYMSRKAYNMHVLYYKCMGLAPCISIWKR